MKLSYVLQGDIKIRNVCLTPLSNNIYELYIQTEQKYFEYCQGSFYSKDKEELNIYLEPCYRDNILYKQSVVSLLKEKDTYYSLFFNNGKYGMGVLIQATKKDDEDIEYNCVYSSEVIEEEENE